MNQLKNTFYVALSCNHVCAFVTVLASMFCLFEVGQAQNDLNVIRGESSNNRWIEFSDASNALYKHLADQAYDRIEKRDQRIANLVSLSDWQGRQNEVREKLFSMVGPFPEKTPLNARILRTVEKETYKVEHIVYESRPEFYVTSSLFIPNGLNEKAPVVIYVSGHTANGYRSEIYQHKILNLVQKKFIVFAFDPVGQGERLEYNIGEEEGRTSVRSPAAGHSYSGAQGYVTGNTQANIMIWDGIRAVDYLLTREEVDPDRIGITGRSGGGTQSAYISAFDDRIYAAAPESYITNFRRLIQSIGPQDSEQNFSGGIENGIDHADLLTVRAPKPSLIISTTEDYFSIQGARETSNEVSKVYSAYNLEEHFGMVEDFGEHGSTQINREAMYQFFQKHLDNPGSVSDVDVEILSEEEIRVTETGQVFTSYRGKTISDLNRELAEEQFSRIENSREDLDRHLSDVAESAKERSGYIDPLQIGEPVLTGRVQREGYMIEKYFVMGEGNYPIPYLLMAPDNPNNKAVLYLHSEGKQAEAGESGQLEWLVKNGYTVLAPDLLGIGEMSPGNSSNLIMQWHASILLNRSITGIRSGDLTRLVKVLQKRNIYSEISGIAVREMAPVLLHSSAFDELFDRMALIEPLLSYRSLVSTKYYDDRFTAGFVAGSMTAYDLPDLAAAFAPKNLYVAVPVSGSNDPVDENEFNMDTSIIYAAYDHADASENLIIDDPETDEEFFESLEQWIQTN